MLILDLTMRNFFWLNIKTKSAKTWILWFWLLFLILLFMIFNPFEVKNQAGAMDILIVLSIMAVCYFLARIYDKIN